MASYTPPPPYCKQELCEAHVPSIPNLFRINRKPLPNNPKFSEPSICVPVSAAFIGVDPLPVEGEIIEQPTAGGVKYHANDTYNGHQLPGVAPLELTVETSLQSNYTNSQLHTSSENIRPSARSGSFTPSSSYASASTAQSVQSGYDSSFSIPESAVSSDSAPSKSAASYVQHAYKEVRHFAGGLITHPYESTKHYTLLRHSHGLVFYQGSNTSLAISIFSDALLPAERTLWLQNKGWSGKTGMRAKAFVGRNGSWLDVTPKGEIGPQQLNPSDERAWQRDITKFQKKAHPKVRENHIIRQTAIIRIPVEAGDGYFQIIMCLGDNKKKVLCTSPTFRLLSTSTDSSAIRGASLSTLPLELGAKLLSAYAARTAGTIISPVASAVKSSVERYMPSFWTQEAITTAYGATGAEDLVNGTIEQGNIRYDEARGESQTYVGLVDITLDDGPQPPYPARFAGRVHIKQSNMIEELNMPVFGLAGVDEGTIMRFNGYYFGWARKIDKFSKDSTWSEAVISVVAVNISHLTRIDFTKAYQRTITLRLINGFEDMPVDGDKFEVRVLGSIRPDEPSQRSLLEQGIREGDEAAHEAAMLCEMKDVEVSQRILDHPAWSADAPVRPSLGGREKSGGIQKLSETYSSARLAAQRHIDRVPIHRIGVRADSHSIKDRTIATNGFYVMR